MAHRPKRARSNSGSTIGDLQAEPSDEPLNPKQLKPHEKLWYDDASIVLATDVHLYRVHKSMLASYSSVFKDMLEIGTDGGDGGDGGRVDPDRYDGLPLVRMAGDSDENVSHLLMTLYDRDFYDIHEPAKFSVITSLLFMSTKYDIPSIRTQVIKHLEKYYPVRLSETFQTSDRGLFDKDAPVDYDFQLLAVAQQCNVRRLLPMMYYKCASRCVQRIFMSSDNFDKDTLQRILTGREILLKLSYDFGIVVCFPDEGCASEACWKARRTMIRVWTNVPAPNNNARFLPIDAIFDGLRVMLNQKKYPYICDSCFKKSAEARENFKDVFWADLPHIFGLGYWHEVMVDDQN
ncbi:hypothetical protein SCHPADRAFT_838281 [Schizopora paradoxa]|uniref:BTB domain-containing protein n=1 Tax=Schizopora paradoxa TaxID=27342 RepID=A0A0H2R9S3_9AGAM|nr:hypothetical protein SCHPADRAFT_838281 [Schizopora paradoxa]